MKILQFKKWEKLTNKILKECWEFRNLCGKPFDRGFIGELLVLSQLLREYKKDLCSNEDNYVIYNGSSNKKWDIELKLDNKIIQINAKATSQLDKGGKPRWVRQSAKTFCDVCINPKNLKQKVSSLKTKADCNFYYVYVDVATWLKNHKVDFFTVSEKEAISIFGKKYYKICNGKIRKTKSTDFWVEYGDIKKFEDMRLRGFN